MARSSFSTLAVEDANFDDGAERARRHAHGGVANVRGLFAEDGAQELLFRRHRAFALRRDLADQDVTRLHFRADIDDAGLIEVLQRFFRDVRNVARDFLRSELGVARHDFKLLDVDRGEDVVGHDTLGEQDRVLVVVAVPRHERDQHVAAERQIAELGRRTVSDDVALVDAVAHAHQRTLVDAGVLVRTLELHQPVDVDAGLAGIEIFRGADDDTRRVHLVDDAAAAGADGGARVTGNDRLHAGADERRLGAHQRHGLTLHVRAHQRAVGVVVLEERDQRRGDRNHLLRRHVHQVDVLARRHHHFAGVTANDEFVDETAILVELGIGLRDMVLGFFHRRQIDDLIGQLAVRSCGTGSR
ncbi:hypothetical protein AJ88_20100 [Mesorhizobium amorphae CCBAU 01583]|nr:hypothetical protein AJ88_20100 [Mesorhizobium amorphae CCBAU 01583]